MDYITAVADEVERLITASHGHSVVLFTSYKVLDMTYRIIENRSCDYPILKLVKSDITVIRQFKESGSGVLFASGSVWEGVDLPGDILSLLIIVRLPFPVPDPISEYEQSLYENFEQYKNTVIVPDMLVKLKQGFGRLL